MHFTRFQVRFCRFEYMTISKFISTGSSGDYAYGAMKIPISVIMELTAGGYYGFDLPAKEIEKNVIESAIGIAAMSEAVSQLFPN